mmetsp:Transcript_17583/g.60826  ORF Transcript_17583/g.60826 Transcript_17583/m.60826 type:complete len:1027 (-) Transcript_17583:210-3290(-)
MKFFVALAGAVLGQVWHASAAAEVEMDVAPDVEIIQRPTLLYSNISPKLRIQGKGFGKNADEIKLPFTPPLSKKGKPIYNISVTDTVLSLGLKKGESWPTSSSGSATLFLQSIIVDKHGPQNQLESAVPVATVIEPPSVVRGEDKVIYMTGTPRFLINGTGFRDGTTTLTFDPPLVRDVDYVLAVRSPTVLQLALKTGRKWRVDGEPGPLRLRRIDSGAGALRIDPKFGGVTVAEVQADLGGHGVSAVGNPTMLIYQNTASVVVKGAGFDHANQVEGFGAPRMRWGNGLLGRGVNFTVSTFDDARVELVLKPGSLWRRNGANLPAPLTLLACDVGSGYVAIGATEAKKGIRVATVFESPAVTPQPLTSLFRTHSAQLWVTGVGFTRAGAAGGLGAEMKLEFEPALRVGVDYTLTVFNRTHALVRLREGRAWAAAPGPLYVTGCDAGAGPYANFKPAAVAHVLPDAAAHESGVEVTRTNHQVLYQTPAIRHLEIHGSSLSQDSKLAFNPPLVKNVDYKVLRATTDVMILALLAGKMWRKTPGQLTLLSVDTGKGDVDMAHGTGIVVADIAANPTVATSTARVTASTTRRLSIYGTGFSIDGTELTLEPTSRSAYDVEAVYENEVVLRLREGKSWGVVPKDAKEAMPLVVTKIDTAAGEYIFQDGAGAAAPVVVAMIVQDSAATGANGDVLRCDDTCMWANDGVCDDGSQDGGGGGEGGADIFDLFFGGGRGGRRQSRAAPGRRKAEDTVHPLKVSLEDLYNGKTAKLAITRNVMKGEPRQCGTCRGQGAVIQMRQIGPGMVQQMQSRCPDCGGTGFSVTMKKERQVLEVNIEKGAKHSTKLRFAAMGNESPNADPGDVIFVLQQKEHNVFKRKGADLLLQRDISLVEALVGFSFTVTQLDGRELLVVSAPGQVVRPEAAPGVPFVMAVADEGMPKAGNPFDKGRLFVLFTIVFPPAHSLSVEKCALLKQALPPPLNNDKYDAEQVEEVVCSEIQLEELGQGQGGGGDEEEEEDERGGGERPVQCQQS